LTELKSDPRRELPAPKAVIHFIVSGQISSADYICFPDIPATSLLRHAYIMRRQAVHHVPQPEKTPLPRGGMDPEEGAKLFSIYLRPWTLIDDCASAHVPHLRNLNVWRGLLIVVNKSGTKVFALSSSPGYVYF